MVRRVVVALALSVAAAAQAAVSAFGLHSLVSDHPPAFSSDKVSHASTRLAETTPKLLSALLQNTGKILRDSSLKGNDRQYNFYRWIPQFVTSADVESGAAKTWSNKCFKTNSVTTSRAKMEIQRWNSVYTVVS
jgi:hypothetical protein